jgi:hypothetical protein
MLLLQKRTFVLQHQHQQPCPTHHSCRITCANVGLSFSHALSLWIARAWCFCVNANSPSCARVGLHGINTPECNTNTRHKQHDKLNNRAADGMRLPVLGQGLQARLNQSHEIIVAEFAAAQQLRTTIRNPLRIASAKMQMDSNGFSGSPCAARRRW